MADAIPAPDTRDREQREPEPLWRELLGRRFRALREERGERLADTAKRAGVSPQYLSEVERGLKDPSSEMVAAILGALDTSLGDVTLDLSTELLLAPVIDLGASPFGRAAGRAAGLAAGPTSSSDVVALAA
jgi:transcriptional regulator with XRE-family HTH domain